MKNQLNSSPLAGEGKSEGSLKKFKVRGEVKK
jgi:hypothetical protein